jgi:hypothetical protein
MRMDGTHAEHQPLSHLRIGKARRDQPQHLQLAPGKPSRMRLRTERRKAVPKADAVVSCSRAEIVTGPPTGAGRAVGLDLVTAFLRLPGLLLPEFGP